MRVEMVVDFGGGRNKHQADRTEPRSSGRPSASEKKLYWLALALHIEDQVDRGRMPSYAEASRRCGVSRARMCTLVSRIASREVHKADSVEDFQTRT